MRKLLLAALLLAAGSASADEGRATFPRACARCHAATAPKPGAKDTPKDAAAAKRALKVEPGRAPDMTHVARARTYAELETWVSSPWKVRPETGCDTKLMRSWEKTDLLGYLSTLPQPRTPDRRTQLKQNLERSVAARKEGPKRDQPQPPPGGKRPGPALPGAKTGGGK